MGKEARLGGEGGGKICGKNLVGNSLSGRQMHLFKR